MDIRQDVFPATVLITGPGSTLDPTTVTSAPPTPGPEHYPLNTARVVVQSNTVIVAIDSSAGPDIRFSEAIDPTKNYKNPDRNLDSYVVTVSGVIVAFRKDNLCGCGSRLRSWNPTRHVTSIKDPTE